MWNNADDGSRTASDLTEDHCIKADVSEDHTWKEDNCDERKMFICQVEKQLVIGLYGHDQTLRQLHHRIIQI